MQKTRKGILLLFAVSLVGIFSALAGTAVAAELPNFELELVTSSIAEGTVQGTVNPGGASTTVKVETRSSGSTSEWAIASETNVGSGTAWVPFSYVIRLTPTSAIEVRVTAINSQGKTRETLSKKLGTKWLIESGVANSSFVSGEGTWKFNLRQGANFQTIECVLESGSGSIGHPGGTGDGYSFKVGNCSYYLNGKFVCHTSTIAGPFNGSMNGSFQNTAGLSKFTWCPGEEGGVDTFQITTPYTVKMSKQFEPLKVQPVTLTTTAMVDSSFQRTGTVTITTNWQLSGEHAGLKFSVGNL
jgi:hypothetical protein